MNLKLILLVMASLFVSQVNAQTNARIADDPISAALLEQSGYEPDTVPLSSFAARKAGADAQKGHYRTRYVGRKNRIVAEKEQTQYEEPAYGTPNEFKKNVLDPTAVASVGMPRSLGMLGQVGGASWYECGVKSGVQSSTESTGHDERTSALSVGEHGVRYEGRARRQFQYRGYFKCIAGV
jgi:hypothetical protein